MSERRPVYLDYAATTPTDERVAALMNQYLCADGEYGNPASTHAYGRAARAAVEAARAQVALLVRARASDMVFTSGATEANNLAILGLVRGVRRAGERARRQGGAVGAAHVITSLIEHKAVLDPCRQLEREGCALTFLSPGARGHIEPGQLAAALRPETVLVSLMHANNETGAITDIAACGELCRAHGAALHVDAAQSAGKLPIDVEAMQIDLLSFTAHKLYGPKGVGALYVRHSVRALLQPLVFGGGHERGLRSGTLPVHQIVGFGRACELIGAECAAEAQRQAALRERLWQGMADLPGVACNSPATHCLPGILNVSFGGIEGESLLFGLTQLALASGSACNSDSDEPSYVLRALGRDREAAQSSLRFSLGHGTSGADIELAVTAVRREVLRLHRVAGNVALPPEAGGLAVAGGAEAAGADAALHGVEGWTVGEAGVREQGTWLRLELGVRAGIIHSAKWQVYGCPHTQRVCEWLREQLPGRALADPALGGPHDWVRALKVPEERLTRLLLIEDALRAACTAPLRPQGQEAYNTGRKPEHEH